MSSVSSAYASLNRYKPSGSVPIASAAAALVIAVVSGVLLGAVYAFVNHHDPLIYLNVLLAIGLGWLLGWLVSREVRMFRIRSRAAAVVIALAAFAAAYLTHWPVYTATVLIDYEVVEGVSSRDPAAIARLSAELAKEPKELWDIIRSLNEEGVWSITSYRRSSEADLEVKGILLALIWLGEALVIGYGAVSKPREAAGLPYSERQGKWLEPKELLGHMAYIGSQEDFFNAVLHGDYSALSTPASEKELKYASVVLYPDAFEPYVTVTNVIPPEAAADKPREGLGKKLFRWFIWDSSKKGEATTIDVVKYLKVSPTVAQSITSALGGFGN